MLVLLLHRQRKYGNGTVLECESLLSALVAYKYNLYHLAFKNMVTLATVITKLTRKGYETQFKVTPEGLSSLSSEKLFRPNEVKVTHFYRFEGESNPADNSILYAIETTTGEMGTLVDGYGISSDHLVDAFIKQVERINK